MNIYAEIAASWVAFDVVLVVVWHAAHVIIRAQHKRPVEPRPAPVVARAAAESHAPSHLTLAKAS